MSLYFNSPRLVTSIFETGFETLPFLIGIVHSNMKVMADATIANVNPREGLR